MSDSTLIDKQIADLERMLQELKQQTAGGVAAKALEPPPLPWEAAGQSAIAGAAMPAVKELGIIPPPLPPQPSAPQEATETRTVNWYSRVAVALILLGVAWLFKLSIDQHWFTPAVWVSLGFLLGTGFVVTGWRLREDRPVLSQSLTGGGQAVFYVTIFAAYTWCKLISHPAAFILMVLVTGGGLWISSRLNAVALALIGMIGGFATPFLLYAGEGNVAALVIYTLIIASGAVVLFWRREWLSIIPVSTLGSLAVFATADERLHSGDMAARISLETGFVAWWLFFWLVPCCKRLTRSGLDEKLNRNLDALIGVLALTLPVITLAYTASIWSMSKHSMGTLALGASVLYLLLWRGFQARQLHMLGLTHLMAGIALFTAGMILCLKGNAVFFIILAQSMVLHEVARRSGSRGWAWLGHLFSAVTGVWVFYRFFEPVNGSPVLNVTGFFNLLALASGFYVWFARRSEPTGLVYWIVANVLLLGWPCREFYALNSGMGWVTVFWGLHGFGLVVWGHRAACPMLKITANVILVLTVCKLIFCDLASVADVWRVVLLLGFGGVFLLMSYLLPRLGGGGQKSC